MSVFLTISIHWIPEEAGGRREAPQPNFRCGIRWLKHIEDSLELSRDVIIRSIVEKSDNIQTLECELITPEIPDTWISPNQGIELLEGPFVIGIGLIV